MTTIPKQRSSSGSSTSPITSLFLQWSQQQQQQQQQQLRQQRHEEPLLEPSRRRPYRILLQTTTDCATRLQASNHTTVEHLPAVYRRAGLRTPSESATRDLLGGPSWFIRIIESLLSTSSEATRVQVVLIRTHTKQCCLSKNILAKMKILELSTDNPWGWDSEDEENDEDHKTETTRSRIHLKNLEELYQSIAHIANSTPSSAPTVLLWESLTPLIMMHGFDRILQFLKSLDLPRCPSHHNDKQEPLCSFFQIWYTRVETMTNLQNAALEDAAHALLYLKDGDMTLMRQGIRETGNIVRENLPFRLEKMVVSERHDGPWLWRVDEHPDKATDGGSVKIDYKDPSDGIDDHVHVPPGALPPDGAPQHASGVPAKSATSGRPKIQLKLEEDDEEKATSRASAKNKYTPTAEMTGRPLIYLEDDDPEFDDLDEEDPDDDLDI